MRFVIVAHRRSETNDALAGAAASLGLPALVLTPRDALACVEPTDVVLGRLDVAEQLDGIEPGLAELERIAHATTLLNPCSALVATHDRHLTARILRRAGVPHPRTWLLSDATPSPAPELPVVLKHRFGGGAPDVTRCDTAEELELALARLAGRPPFADHGVLAQELVPAAGRHLRLVVAGERIVGAACSTEPRLAPLLPPPVAGRLALEAARAVRGDLVGVDLLPLAGGFVVAGLSCAVDFTTAYAFRPGDVFRAAVHELLRTALARRAAA